MISRRSSNSRATDVTGKDVNTNDVTTHISSSSVLHSNTLLMNLMTKSDVITIGRKYRSTSHHSDKMNPTSRTTEYSRLSVTSSGVTSSCRLRSANSSVYEHVRYLVDQERVKLIEFHLDLLLNVTNSSLAEGGCMDVDHGVQLQPCDSAKSIWSRVSGRHGLALLSLGFNYAAMSLMTLSVGVAAVHVTITDQPTGCYNELDECRRLEIILHLLQRDLQVWT